MKKIRKWNSILYSGEIKSFLLLMKLTFILTLAATLNVSALVYSQNSKLNLSVEGQTLRDVLKNHFRGREEGEKKSREEIIRRFKYRTEDDTNKVR